jgi:hypothetical protein
MSNVAKIDLFASVQLFSYADKSLKYYIVTSKSSRHHLDYWARATEGLLVVAAGTHTSEGLLDDSFPP